MARRTVGPVPIHSATADLRRRRTQPPGALIRSLISGWSPSKRAGLLQLLGVGEGAFSKLLVGACPITKKQAANLAKATGIPETAFLEREQRFTSWWETLAYTRLTVAENVGDILFSAEEISRRIASLALEMENVFYKDVVIIAVLKGGLIFSADLIRVLYSLGVDASFGFIQLKAYDANRMGKQSVEVVTDVSENLIKDKTVVIVDDVHDTGKTLDRAVPHVKRRGAREIVTCVLIDKLSPTLSEQKRTAPDYVGFRVTTNSWLVGYGMDDDEYMRGSSHILARRD
jgi:hypoxanthine phosphoribosyltransferase